MAFVRSKKIRRGDREYVYFQLVRGYRQNGSVKQEVLVHLGTHETPQAALVEWEKRAARYRLFGRMSGQKEALAAKLVARAERYEEKIRSLRAAL
jgi:hypothetical protein